MDDDAGARTAGLGEKPHPAHRYAGLPERRRHAANQTWQWVGAATASAQRQRARIRLLLGLVIASGNGGIR